AGITTKGGAYAHYVLNGQFEGRQYAPTPEPDLVQTLTIGKDTLFGTDGDDVFEAPVDLEIFNNGPVYQQTLQGQDKIDGGAGHDKLIAELNGMVGTSNPTLSNIEELVLTVTDNGELDMSRA